jgi:hypothetical protein
MDVEITEDWGTGEIGFRPVDAGDAYWAITHLPGIAHDCLEHLAGFDSVGDEIVAHGVMYWLRYESGYTPPYDINPHSQPMTLESIGQEWGNLYRGLAESPMGVPPADEGPLDEWRESDIRSIMAAGIRECRAELGEDLCRKALNEIRQNFISFFRYGIRLAESTYGEFGRDRVCGWFDEIMRDFQGKLKHIEELQGSDTRVSVSIDEGQLNIKLTGLCSMCGVRLDDIEELWEVCEDCSSDN